MKCGKFEIDDYSIILKQYNTIIELDVNEIVSNIIRNTVMVSPETDLTRLKSGIKNIRKKEKITIAAPILIKSEKVFSIREAYLMPKEKLPTKECLGKVLAVGALSCPPAVAPVVCGERIDLSAIEWFEYYGTDSLWVVKEEK